MAESGKQPRPSGFNRTETPRNSSNTHKWRCRTCTVVLLSTFVAVVGVLSAVILQTYLQEQAETRKYVELRIGEEGLELFKGYDRDADGYISLAEFEPIVEKLLIEDGMADQVDFGFEEVDVDPAEEILTVEAYFKPLLQETMKKAEETQSSRYATALTGLNDWQEPNQALAAFPVGQFKVFLPDEITPVGKPYTVIKSNLNLFANTLSSNRFYPPRVKHKEVVIHRLLSMLHKRPFVHTRFGPQGTIAVIRAENEKYVDVAFRIHAEFQLNEPPNNPFWFTPGQFVGNIILTKDSSHIQHFSVYVPTNSSLNVDMEWLYGSSETSNMEVDIGFLPQMELKASEPSMQVAVYGENGEIIFQPEHQDSQRKREAIVWDFEISLEEAFKAIEIQFYPFKKIPYVPFEDAFKKADAEKKLVHTILLWGALDDQSC